MKCRLVLAGVLGSLVTACGSEGSGDGGGGEQVVRPIALVFVSGHFDFENPATSYLDRADSAGPFLVAALEAAGYTTTAAFFVDGDTEPGGFADLVAHLEALRDAAAGGGPAPRVVLVSHSHGGPWATAATLAVPDLRIDFRVDLDTTSVGWSIVHDAADVAALGGDPEDRFDLGLPSGCADFPGAPNESGTLFDLEDVVPDNVGEALEVRSGEVGPVAGEPFDEHWNLRLDGTSAGLTCLFSATFHTEVHSATGTTLPLVRTWILDRLAAAAPAHSPRTWTTTDRSCGERRCSAR